MILRAIFDSLYLDKIMSRARGLSMNSRARPAAIYYEKVPAALVGGGGQSITQSLKW